MKRPTVTFKKGLVGSSAYWRVEAFHQSLERNHSRFNPAQYETIPQKKQEKLTPEVALHLYTEVCICGKWVRLLDYREQIYTLINDKYKMR